MKHRRWMLIALGALISLSISCGTVNVDLKTDIQSSGEVDQEVVLRASGLLAQAMQESVTQDSSMLEKSRNVGWNVEAKTEGSDYVIIMSKHLKRGEEWWPPYLTESSQSESITEKQPKVDFAVKESTFSREYQLLITIPPSPQPTPTDAGMEEFGISDEQMLQLISSLFKISWTINLPGEVVDTNANSKTNTGGTWQIDWDQLQNGMEIRLVSRERKLGTVPIVIGGVVILAIAAFGAHWLLRRPSPPTPL